MIRCEPLLFTFQSIRHDKLVNSPSEVFSPDEGGEGTEETADFIDGDDCSLDSTVVDIGGTRRLRLWEVGVKLVRSDDTGHETLHAASHAMSAPHERKPQKTTR